MRIVLAPVPVRIVNAPSDLTGWLSLAAAVLALVLAVYAIWQTCRQAIAASQQINVERRKVFELNILRDLLALDHVDQIWNGRSVALVEALPHDELSLWRTILADSDHLDWVRVMEKEGGLIGGDFDLAEIGQRVTEILDRRGARPGESWRSRLWQALVDDVRKSIVKRVEDGQGGSERHAGPWHGLMVPVVPAHG